ncbi:hypothetical protein QE152_g8698 [Popillia japonica]|uniref:Uncharacterized protein n=1 Tax=Popillia japonica TaxID=7064 RepID=A0AAW1M5W4_POPJA
MMKRLLELKDAPSIAVTTLSNLPVFLNAQEWNALKGCVTLLTPVELLTTVLSNEKYVTMSLVIPLIRGLQHSLKATNPITQTGQYLKTALQEIISRRLGSFETNKIVANATFLDPRFKKVGFGLEENANNSQKWATDELTQLISKKKSYC